MTEKKKLYPSLSLIETKNGFHVQTWGNELRPETNGNRERRSPSPSPSAISKTEYDIMKTSIHLDPDSVRRLHNQNYEKIRRDCYDRGEPFVDPHFSPPADQTWRRPREIVKNPHFVLDGFSRLDPNQGDLKDCWLVAALMNLTRQPLFLQHAIPADNSFHLDCYAGIFHFRFWQYGEWVEVVIDDRLPTFVNADDEEDVRLTYISSTESNEFWCALIEKAYAKLYDGYKNLDYGKSCEAMQDLTGGVTEFIECSPNMPKEKKEELFQKMELCCNELTMMVARKGRTDSSDAHAYYITKVITRKVDETRRFVCLRNPWGGDGEQNLVQQFNKDYPESRQIPKEVLAKMNIIDLPDDGEFWLEYEDFLYYIKHMQICQVNPVIQQYGWNCCILEGQWTAEMPGGNSDDCYCENPVYKLQVGDMGSQSPCRIIFTLIQKNRRLKGLKNLNINFRVYPLLDEYENYLDNSWINEDNFHHKSGKYINLRENSLDLNLQPGNYAVVPSRNTQDSCEFMIRIFSKKTVRVGCDMGCNADNSLAMVKPVKDEVDNVVDAGDGPKFTKYYTELFKEDKDKLMKKYSELADKDWRMNWVDLKSFLDNATTEEFQAYTSLTGSSPVRERKKSNYGFINKCMIAIGLQDQEVEVNNGDKIGFHIDTCKSMIQMSEGPEPDKISLESFAKLIDDLAKWTGLFRSYANSKTKLLEERYTHQALDALNLAGNSVKVLKIRDRVYNYVIAKYERDDKTLSFNKFIVCATEIKLVYAKYNQTDNVNKFRIKKWI